MYIFTLYRIPVIILTPLLPHPHIHSTVKLSRKGVLQTKREAFFKKMCFQILLEREERWRAADVCRNRVPDFSSLKVERSVSSSFDVSFGTFNTLERVSEARRRSGGTEFAAGVCMPLVEVCGGC